MLVSCHKESSLETISSSSIPDPVSYYSKVFLMDTSFYRFLTTISKNSLEQAKKVKGYDTATRISMIDSNSVYQAAAENLTSLYFLETNHPQFSQLSLSEKTTILNNLADSLSSTTFRNQNPNNPLIQYEFITIPALIEYDSIAIAQRFAFSNISSGEFWGCTLALGIGALGEYGGILNDLKWLIQNGSNSWGAVLNLAWDLVKNAVPWWKVARLALGYAACLWVSGQS